MNPVLVRRAAGARRAVLFLIAAAGAWAFAHLLAGSPPRLPDLATIGAALEFVSDAAHPALVYESESVPRGAPPLLVKALLGARTTVVFAAAATSLALVIGAVLGFFASTAWWSADVAGAGGRLAAALRRGPGALVYASSRVLIAAMRSVHELLWAVVFLAAFGLTGIATVVAIAIPFGATLAKVFSELIDEAPRDAAAALAAAGARPAQVYLFGLVPRALPDMGAYALYRFECALRSSAVLGFFGPETLGKFIKQSWDENHYGEVWTYLYTLFALIALADWWSGAMRRRFAA